MFTTKSEARETNNNAIKQTSKFSIPKGKKLAGKQDIKTAKKQTPIH